MPQIKDDTTNVTRYIMVLDSSGSAVTGATITNFDLQYTRAGVAPATKADATALAATDSAHADNKMIEIDGTSSPGLYRVDWPDAAFATGVDHVILTVTNPTDSAVPAVEEISLVGNVVADVVDSSGRVDVGLWLGTAVTLSATTTLPEVDVASVSDDATAANNLELQYDTTGLTGDTFPATQAHSTRIFAGTSTASSTASKVFVQAGDPPSGGADDDYNDTIIIVWDGTDKTTARVAVRSVTDYDDSDPSFTLDSDLPFTPGSGDLVEVYAANAADLAALSKLASGFAATAPDRLIDYLRAMMSKTATAPTTGTGTYSPATDSLEHLGESLDLMAGSGFATGTDSLKEIRDAIDTLVAPSVVSSSALSGSGFLSDCVSLIRKATDEPGTNPKYTDGDIVELLQAAIDAVLTDIDVNTDHPIMIRHTITLVSGEQDYILPPQVGELIRVTKENTSTGLPEYESWPGSYQDPSRKGWKLEGNVLRLLADWISTETLTLLYHPNAEPLIHKATASAIDADTVTFPTSVTDGTLGTRPNEYVGMIIRILSSTQGYQEERLITAYDVTTRIATINKAWDVTPTGTVVYEVVPVFGRLIKHVVSLRAALDLLSQEGNSQRMSTLERNYMLKLSAMRRAISKKEARFPHHFDGDTWDNSNRGGYGY